ncbi:MAG: hypothetical protein ACREGF_04540, partial [Candidatus Saccharimonadales bacterium]
MGIFKPFVGGVKSSANYRTSAENHQAENHQNDQPFTPSDALSLSRPALAIKAGRMLVRGERNVTPLVVALAATDMEGKLARLIDKLAPDSGWGSTAHGEALDIAADTSALLIVGGAILKAPRVSAPAKFAVATVLGQEAFKAGWAIDCNHKYMAAVRQRQASAGSLFEAGIIAELPEFPSKLKLPVSAKGKEAMAEKMTAVIAAVATNDLDPGAWRNSLAATSLAFAAIGSAHG